MNFSLFNTSVYNTCMIYYHKHITHAWTFLYYENYLLSLHGTPILSSAVVLAIPITCYSMYDNGAYCI